MLEIKIILREIIVFLIQLRVLVITFGDFMEMLLEGLIMLIMAGEHIPLINNQTLIIGL